MLGDCRVAANQHVETIHEGCESYEKICGKMGLVGFWATGPGKKCTRTEVSFNFNWIIEVDHLRQVAVGNERDGGAGS